MFSTRSPSLKSIRLSSVWSSRYDAKNIPNDVSALSPDAMASKQCSTSVPESLICCQSMSCLQASIASRSKTLKTLYRSMYSDKRSVSSESLSHVSATSALRGQL